MMHPDRGIKSPKSRNSKIIEKDIPEHIEHVFCAHKGPIEAAKGGYTVSKELVSFDNNYLVDVIYESWMFKLIGYDYLFSPTGPRAYWDNCYEGEYLL